MEYKEELMTAHCMLQDIAQCEQSRMSAEEEQAFKVVTNVIGRAMLMQINGTLTLFRMDSEDDALTEQKMEDIKLYFGKASEAMKRRETKEPEKDGGFITPYGTIKVDEG